ncbi:MAG: hypothetical protein M3680_11915 [Myxococcota bacterium]|nr:hypothetical protein [Myxococcota bacterium]
MTRALTFDKRRRSARRHAFYEKWGGVFHVASGVVTLALFVPLLAAFSGAAYLYVVIALLAGSSIFKGVKLVLAARRARRLLDDVPTARVLRE